MKQKIVTVVGTRPEIIRLESIIKALDRNFDHKLVHTGQNFDKNLSQVFFDELGIRKPDLMLECSNKSLGNFLGELFPKIEDFLENEKPDAVLILGDTNSSFVAIQAKRMGIPVYHLEAGNRSFDINVPEEINRRIIDHCADFNMCYTEHARRNLLSEGLHPRNISVIGSPLMEVITKFIPLSSNSRILSELSLEAKEYFLVSFHRQENVDVYERLEILLNSLNLLAEEFKIPILVSTHPRTKDRISESGLSMNQLIKFHEPFGFLDYLKLQLSAKIVISDSGSISEEAAILGITAISIRNSIERPEAIESGGVILSGIEHKSILNSIESILDSDFQPTAPPEYLIRDCSQRVIRIIQSTLPNYNFWSGKRLTN
jgi:UDP-N-acetylglucosamine 2-epimerase